LALYILSRKAEAPLKRATIQGDHNSRLDILSRKAEAPLKHIVLSADLYLGTISSAARPRPH